MRLLLEIIIGSQINMIGGESGLDASSSGWRPVAGSCERSNEPSGPIKFWKFLE
jgi:hypothetical protein